MSWQAWREMQRESLRAARKLENKPEECYRSSVSRYYYAAYQAVTAALLYRKQIPPESREAWSHENTPDIAREHLMPIAERRKINQLVSSLKYLYKLRIYADYTSADLLDRDKVREVGKQAGIIIKVIDDILEKG